MNPPELSARHCKGRQNGSHLVHAGDGYFYRVREVRGLRVRLKCRFVDRSHSPCPGTASMRLSTLTLHHINAHNHPPDPLLEAELNLRQEMVEDAKSQIQGCKISSILLRHKISCGNADLASRFTPVRMNSSLYRARATNYPNIPKTLLHLGVLLGLPNTRQICMTADRKDFIYQGVVGCEQKRTVAIIFVSGRMINFLNSLENLHADGTFKKRSKKPKMSQIFNITTKFGDKVIGVVRILMMSRTEEAYVAVLRFLLILAPRLDPRRIHCDYERAEMNAFQLVFPWARVVGCLWHYGVAFSKHARKLGLAALAQEYEAVYDFIQCLAGAPLLPQVHIWDGVLEIWNEIEEAGFGDDFLPLLQYFEREWKPRLPELSVFGIAERTNNCSESDNRGLSNVLPQNGPNIWHLLSGFVQLEYSAYCDVLAVRRGTQVSDGRRYYAVLNDERIRRLSGLLVAGQVTPGEFLHSASYANQAAVAQGLHLPWNEDSSSDEDE